MGKDGFFFLIAHFQGVLCRLSNFQMNWNSTR